MSSSSSVSSDDTAVEDKPPSPSGRFELPSPSISGLTHFPYAIVLWLAQLLYNLYQIAVDWLFTVPYKPLGDQKPLGRIAIIGAGLTGISSAAHAVAQGFDVVIFDAEAEVGGIWARVNSTSSLQLNSILYRFHPAVKWSRGFPERDEILSQINKLVDMYHLGPKIRLNTKVEKITRHKSSTDPKEGGHGRWLINEGGDGVFDGLIVAVGTCGKPNMVEFEGQDAFSGSVIHSSQLDNANLKGKRVVIIGSGASGVEAAELAVSKKAKDAIVIARDDKWCIPRNTLFDILLALQPFGRQTPTSWIPEWFVRLFHYRDLVNISPAPKVGKGLFEGTPIVNDEFLQHIRQGKTHYIRGDTLAFTEYGVKINERERGSKPGDKGRETVLEADVIVLATGYKRPSIDMLPKDLFPVEGERDYQRPNLYLQNFATEDCSVLLTNASYMDAIGTVGNYHVGIYARILMMFLCDRCCRPVPRAMKLWVDLLTWIKFTAWGQQDDALSFFTYFELCLWTTTFHLFRLTRLPWLPFVLFGWGKAARGLRQE